MHLFYAFFLLLLPFHSPADYDVTGTVEDPDGEPLAGATVQVEALDRGVTTGPDGQFAFTNLPAGSYTLRVQFVGFQATTVPVDVPQDEPLRVVLQPEDVQLRDVIVTASPVGSTQYQATQSFDIAALQEQGASSFGEMLDGEPGIAMRSFGPAPARPVIRGFDGDRLLILENSERRGDISNTAADHNITLDPLAADRVEVVRGPASLLYGSSAIGGVINIFTSDIPRTWAPGQRGSVALETASMNNSLTGFGRYQIASDAWAGTARFSYRDAGNVRTPEGILPDTGIQNFEGAVGLAHRTDRFTGGLSFTALDHTFGLPEEIDDPDEEAEIRLNQQILQGRATWDVDGFFESVELRLRASRFDQQEVETEFAPDGSIDEEDIELTYDDLSANTTLTLVHRAVGPLDAGAIGLTLGGRQLDVGGDDAFTPGVQRANAALFTFQEVPLSERVRLQIGLRGEIQQQQTRTNDDFPTIDESRDEQAFSGSVGLNFQPNQNLEIGVQAARAHRFPLLEEVFADGVHFGAGVYERGDPTLETERSLGTDLFIRWTSGRLFGEVAGFYNRVSDFIAFQPTGETFTDDSDRVWDVFEYQAADAELLGGEVQLGLRLTEALSIRGSVDYVEGTRVDTDKPLPTMPPLRGRISARYETDRFHVGANVRMVDEQTRVAEEELPTDGYTLLGATAGVQLDGAGAHRITLRADNITDVTYRDHLSRIDRSKFGFPMPGRNVSLGYRYTF